MPQFSKEKTALVVVDMQNDFVRVGGAMEVPDTRKTIAPIQALIRMAREQRMPVIYSLFVAGPKYTMSWDWSREIPDNNCCMRNFKRTYGDIEGERYCTAVVDELAPEPDDYVFEKYGYSAFRNSPLRDILFANHCDAIIVTGTVTQLCVADTVKDAYAEKVRALVASDCVSSFSELQQQAALENFALKYGYVEDSARIIERFSK